MSVELFAVVRIVAQKLDHIRRKTGELLGCHRLLERSPAMRRCSRRWAAHGPGPLVRKRLRYRRKAESF